jgi:DNA-binding LytR/AlgR family response regulator
MRHRVLIVDDEPIARSILENYVGMLPQLELVGSAANAIEALQTLGNTQVDLLLLDIDMPQINGISFLQSLRNPPPVIMTTAYSEYALEGYEQGVLDYLMKPIRFERFLRAVNKLQVSTPATTALAAPAETTQAGMNILFVKSEGRLVRIDLAAVQFIEGLRDYVAFHTAEGKLVIHSTMKALEERLAAMPEFVRIHKSYIVNLAYVREIDGASVRVGPHSLLIGATFRDSVTAALERYRLI